MSDHEQKQAQGWLSQGRHRVAAVVIGVGILGASVYAVQAIADTRTYQHLRLFTSENAAAGELHMAGWRGHRRGGWSDLSNAEIEDRITRIVRHAAIEIDATEEQQARMIGILTPVAINMKSMRGEMRGTGMEFFDLLTEGAVDRAAIETLRTEKLAEIDEISKEWVTAITDVSMVLTAEQRELIRQRVEDLPFMRRGWRR